MANMKEIKYSSNIIIIFLSLFSLISCATDTIGLKIRPCLFKDKLSSDEEIISFDYTEGHIRPVHATYEQYSTDSVKMVNTADWRKFFYMKCTISPKYATITNNLYHYRIPCGLDHNNLVKLTEGTYCIEIVKEFIGDITSMSFCIDSYNFNVINSYNLPNLDVYGFSEDQEHFIQKGGIFTLLAAVKNMMSVSQDYEYIGIGLSSTENDIEDIALKCKIEGHKNINQYDEIICEIPEDEIVQEGYYSVLYSDNLQQIKKCPNNYINKFNSINFQNELTKLYVYLYNPYSPLETKIVNITFINPSKINFTFYLENVAKAGSDPNLLFRFSFEEIENKDIGIKLIDKLGTHINTKCDLIQTNANSIFYIICTPNYYEKDTKYSLVISKQITIGYDTTKILFTLEGITYYKKIYIYSREFDIFIFFDPNSPYLDCDQNAYRFRSYEREEKGIPNLCGYCPSNCLMCENEESCYKCLDGFTLKNSGECNLNIDTINFDKFQELINFIPHNDTCDLINENNRQLFSFVFSYIINKGENFAIQSGEYNDIIFGKNQNDEKFGLKCIIDINPKYFPSEQYSGTCKEKMCIVMSFVNCSFHEKVPNGIYDIQSNSNTELGNLINKAKDEINPIQIKYSETKIFTKILEDSIQVVYEGYAPNSQEIYICKYSNVDKNDCNHFKSCKLLSYDILYDESILNCSKEFYKESDCYYFQKIIIKDKCDNDVIENFEYQICKNSSKINFINLFMLFFILMVLI